MAKSTRTETRCRKCGQPIGKFHAHDSWGDVLYDRVLGVLEKQIAAKIDWFQYTRLGVLGLDEIVLLKGYRGFVVIVARRLADGQVKWLCWAFYQIGRTSSILEQLKSTVHSACCHMYKSYTEALSEELYKVCIVINRFHVAKTYRDGVDGLRKRAMKRLKSTLPKQSTNTQRHPMGIPTSHIFSYASFSTRKAIASSLTTPRYNRIHGDSQSAEFFLFRILLYNPSTICPIATPKYFGQERRRLPKYTS